MDSAVYDQLHRPLRSLRISVTDRCNLRCAYCMPEEEYVWIPRHDLLSFEEIERLVRLLAPLGVRDLRLTGGEPLLRRELPDLVRRLAAIPGVADLALTTNGVLLAASAAELLEAGLRRFTISLDSLRPERFARLAGRDELPRVLAGIAALGSLGARGTKLNMVVMRGVNDDELREMLAFGRAAGAEVRFIEYMDVGGATQWNAESVVSRREILDRLASRHGPIEPVEHARRAATAPTTRGAETNGSPSGPLRSLDEDEATGLRQRDSAPSERFRLPDGTTFGVIASTTAPFCRTCDRARLTADGMFFTCLYATAGLDLRRMLRGGASDDELAATVRDRWQSRDDRGAEQRAALRERGPFVPLTVLRKNKHLEMHTRGG